MKFSVPSTLNPSAQYPKNFKSCFYYTSIKSQIRGTEVHTMLQSPKNLPQKEACSSRKNFSNDNELTPFREGSHQHSGKSWNPPSHTVCISILCTLPSLIQAACTSQMPDLVFYSLSPTMITVSSVP